MAMMGSKCRFLWGTVVYPATHMMRLYFNLRKFSSDTKEGKLIPQMAKNLNGVLVPPLATMACKALWKCQSQNPKHRYFNYRLSRARMLTEKCYGQFKGRSQILLRKGESSTDVVRASTLACIKSRNNIQKAQLNSWSHHQPEARQRGDTGITSTDLWKNYRLKSSSQCEKLFAEKESGKVC